MDMLVLPDLTKDICNFLKNGNGAKQLAFTNVSAGQFEKILKENGGADLMEKADAVYVPFAREELSDPDLLEDSNVFYQGEWHLVRYMMQNHAEEIYAVRDGETCPQPGMADVYSYPPIGTVLYHKGYDLNGDGEPDELPEKVTENLVIQCLYEIAEKEHTWELEEIVRSRRSRGIAAAAAEKRRRRSWQHWDMTMRRSGRLIWRQPVRRRGSNRITAGEVHAISWERLR